VPGLCISEARPLVLLIFLLRFLAGGALGPEAAGPGQLAQALAAALTWQLAVFACYLFNGAMDVQEDRLNRSIRPIARGRLSPGVAGRLALCAAALAAAASVGLDLPTAGMVLVLLALGYLYSGPPFHFKRRPIAAPATGAAAGLLTYHAGFATHTGTSWADPGVALAIFAVGMSLWMGLVGALTKDLADVEGDAAAGRRTMAVVQGGARTRLLASACALAVATTFSGLVLHSGAPLVLPAIELLVGGAAVAVVSLTRLSQGERAQRRFPYRMYMLTQYTVHISLLFPICEAGV
jgi:4-hydroxybenzoate polyprenyltransferase